MYEIVVHEDADDEIQEAAVFYELRWLKTIPPILTAVTGLLGTLIEWLAILRASK